MNQGISHFLGFLQPFVLAKLASIRVKCTRMMLSIRQGNAKNKLAFTRIVLEILVFGIGHNFQD